MKAITKLTSKSGSYGEFTCSDNHIIVGSIKSNGNYPLGDNEIFRRKYGNPEKIEFEQTGQSIYKAKLLLSQSRRNTYSKEIDKMDFIDLDTGAYYVTDMGGVEDLLHRVANGTAKMYKDREDTVIETEFFLEFRGRTLFLNFDVDSKLNELRQKEEKKRRQIESKKEALTPSQLEPWTLYTYLSDSDEKEFFTAENIIFSEVNDGSYWPGRRKSDDEKKEEFKKYSNKKGLTGFKANWSSDSLKKDLKGRYFSFSSVQLKGKFIKKKKLNKENLITFFRKHNEENSYRKFIDSNGENL